jgi:cobalt-zinc-cadmium efflux system outer membrane protein
MTMPSEKHGALKCPSAARILRALAFAASVLCATDPARAEPRVLTEADVLAAARARNPELNAARASVAVSTAREAGAGRYPNPSIAWSREHIPGDGPLAEREDAFELSVPIELGGARSAQRALAEAETAEARADATLAATRAALHALEQFYEAIAAREQAVIARRQVERLAEAERVLARRVAEGSASGYELARLQLEAELARSAHAEHESSALAQLSVLSGIIGIPAEGLELRGDLATAEPDQAARASRALREVQAAESAAARAQDAASSAWLPPLEARVGPKLAGAGNEDAVGYVAGLSLELPLFERKQGLGAEASATTGRLRARHEAIARATDQAALRARGELERARAELLRFDHATAARAAELERAAEAAYREGRQSILELLDAQRMRTSLEERKLELQLLAKRAELQLRAARGELEGGPR